MEAMFTLLLLVSSQELGGVRILLPQLVGAGGHLALGLSPGTVGQKEDSERKCLGQVHTVNSACAEPGLLVYPGTHPTPQPSQVLPRRLSWTGPQVT